MSVIVGHDVLVGVLLFFCGHVIVGVGCIDVDEVSGVDGDQRVSRDEPLGKEAIAFGQVLKGRVIDVAEISCQLLYNFEDLGTRTVF